MYKEDDLFKLEETHNSILLILKLLVLEVYTWLSMRYGSIFVEQDLCKVLTDRCCEIIEKVIREKTYHFAF